MGETAKKYFTSDRLFSVAKNIVFIGAVLAGLSAVYYGYIVGSDAIQKEWSGYCSQYKDPSEYTSCMMLSLKLIARFKKLLWINTVLAVVLLFLYGLGVWIYKKTAGNARKEVMRERA